MRLPFARPGVGDGCFSRALLVCFAGRGGFEAVGTEPPSACLRRLAALRCSARRSVAFEARTGGGGSGRARAIALGAVEVLACRAARVANRSDKCLPSGIVAGISPNRSKGVALDKRSECDRAEEDCERGPDEEEVCSYRDVADGVAESEDREARIADKPAAIACRSSIGVIGDGGGGEGGGGCEGGGGLEDADKVRELCGTAVVAGGGGGGGGGGPNRRTGICAADSSDGV